ncbi:hypothetical protein [Pelomonas cellulosilytica]|uniref:Hemerythrin-like domain-containing protein n=1 Tax=Pelomonas cellulosilytica TaxID=2906762 RepID=A0ABS8XSE2_9BURK|nr:hypothetical protein [Pelomonas sp. P8]MCE4555639.1 hypothetical protein [Pelomonas sp. P8]
MTPAPRTPRHDPYRFIHKGLRAALFGTVQALGQADPADDAALAAALDGADDLLTLLLEHQRQENHWFHVAIEARRPGAAQALGDEHARSRESLTDLQDDVQHLRRAGPASRGTQLHWLYQRFCAVAAEQLVHMAREEAELNPVLWQLYSDDELRALQQQLLAASEPRLLRLLVRWMSQALAPRELAGLLALARRMAPDEAFQALMADVEALSVPARWAAVQVALADRR